MTEKNEPTRFGRILVLLVIGPILIIGYRTGSRISAEREADRFVRQLGSVGRDGRPDPRALAHIERGSGALLEVLEQQVREGPFEYRAPIARALGYSRRLEVLRELILELRDGCFGPDLAVLPRQWPCPVYPPDELALEADGGVAAMEGLEKDADPFVRSFAHTFLVAEGKRSLDLDLVRLLGEEGILGERAGALAASQLEAPHVTADAAPALLAMVGETPRGRLAAVLLEKCGRVPPARDKEVHEVGGGLTAADLMLVRDPHAVARAERSLARGDARAADTLATLAAVASHAREALIAAVGSSESAEVRSAAEKALERTR